MRSPPRRPPAASRRSTPRSLSTGRASWRTRRACGATRRWGGRTTTRCSVRRAIILGARGRPAPRRGPCGREGPQGSPAASARPVAPPRPRSAGIPSPHRRAPPPHALPFRPPPPHAKRLTFAPTRRDPPRRRQVHRRVGGAPRDRQIPRVAQPVGRRARARQPRGRHLEPAGGRLHDGEVARQARLHPRAHRCAAAPEPAAAAPLGPLRLPAVPRRHPPLAPPLRPQTPRSRRPRASRCPISATPRPTPTAA